MNRGRFALVLVAVMLVGVNVRAGWQESLRQVETRVAAERAAKSAALTPERLKALSATPEMLFSDVATVLPGQTVTVLAQGKFAPDTTFVVRRDDVEVQSASMTAKGWKATLKVKADAWLGDVSVTSVASVSGRERTEVAAHVAGKYAIDLQLANGWTAKFTPAEGSDDDWAYRANAEWFRAGSKTAFRTGEVMVRVQEDSVEVDLTPTAAEVDSSIGDSEALAAAMQEAMPAAKMDELNKKMEACQKVTVDRMEACLQPYVKEMEALSKAAEAKVMKVRDGTKTAQGQKAFGCTMVRLSRSEAGQVAGSVEGCEGTAQTPVKTAKLTYRRP